MSTLYGAPDDELRPIAHSRLLAFGNDNFGAFSVPGLPLACADVRSIAVAAASGGTPLTITATFDLIDPVLGTTSVTNIATSPGDGSQVFVRNGGHVLTSLVIDDGGAGSSGAWAVTASNLDPLAPKAAAAGGGAMAAAAQRTSFSLPGDGSNHWVTMQQGVGGGSFYTSDAVWMPQPHRMLGGVDTYGVGATKPGTYRIDVGGFFQGGTPGALVNLFYTPFNGNEGLGQLGRTGYLVGDTWDAGTTGGWSHVSFTEWVSADPTSLPLEWYVVLMNQLGAAPVTVHTITLYVSFVADLEVPAGAFW